MATFKILGVQDTKAQGKSGKPYTVALIDYINEQGQAKQERLMQFKDKDLYAKALGLKAGDVIDVELVQDGQYFNWGSWKASTSKGPTVVGSGTAGSASERFDMADSAKDESIKRQVALKAAVEHAATIKGSTTENVVLIAEAFLSFLKGGEVEIDPASDLADIPM